MPLEYLRHIAAEIEFLVRESGSVGREDFLADEVRRRAFVRSLEIIGEAAKQLPEEFISAHPEIEWSGMAKMRDRLIHGYFGVDYELVWDVVTMRVPQVGRQIAKLLGDD